MDFRTLLPTATLLAACACGGPALPQTVADLPDIDTSRVLADITRLA